ncbi:MAG: sodium:calcium antiporter, partial [Chloroflexota bacterium]
MVALGSLIVIIVSVYFLAIITEEFFVISLDAVSQRFSIPSDVAGASLMAIGSSAPELFIALIAVFTGGDHADVGIGTIVG